MKQEDVALSVSFSQLTYSITCWEVLSMCVRLDRINEIMVVIHQSSLKRRTVLQFQMQHGDSCDQVPHLSLSWSLPK